MEKRPRHRPQREYPNAKTADCGTGSRKLSDLWTNLEGTPQLAYPENDPDHARTAIRSGEKQRMSILDVGTIKSAIMQDEPGATALRAAPMGWMYWPL